MVDVAQRIGESSLAKSWQYFVPPKDFSLVTSDNPAVFSVASQYSTIEAGPASPLSELVINLRKDLALVCTPHCNGNDTEVIRIASQEGKKYNRGIVRAA